MKKEKQRKSMRELFYDNVDLLNQAFQAMSEAVQAYYHKKPGLVKEKAEETIRLEKAQDRLREELVARIFSKETMVFSRPDRLNLVESMDKLCDEAEIVVRKLLQYSPEPPAEIGAGLEEMAVNTAKIGEELKGLIRAVLEDFSKGDAYIDRITDIRREVRDRHWELLNKLYEIKPDPLDFIYFENLIKSIAKTADRVEEFGDKIHGLLCKYAL
jgi:predicted phosphate transport protein (TIGR00153 family)